MDPLAQAFAYYNFDETAGPHRVHRRAWCSRSTSSTRTTSSPATSPRTTAGTTTGARAPTRCWAGARSCRAAATAPSRWARSWPTATSSPSCQVEKVFKTVCLRRRSTPRPRRGQAHHRRVPSPAATRMKHVFAETAVVLHGQLREPHVKDLRSHSCAAAAAAPHSPPAAAARPTTSIRTPRRRRSPTTPVRRRPPPTCSPSASTSGRTSRPTTAAVAATTPPARRRVSRATTT